MLMSCSIECMHRKTNWPLNVFFLQTASTRGTLDYHSLINFFQQQLMIWIGAKVSIGGMKSSTNAIFCCSGARTRFVVGVHSTTVRLFCKNYRHCIFSTRMLLLVCVAFVTITITTLTSVAIVFVSRYIYLAMPLNCFLSGDATVIYCVNAFVSYR